VRAKLPTPKLQSRINKNPNPLLLFFFLPVPFSIRLDWIVLLARSLSLSRGVVWTRKEGKMEGGVGGEVDHLAGERATAQFDVEHMKVAWAGSRHAVDVADRMARLVASDPVTITFSLFLSFFAQIDR
jgi:hypothetical protein